MRPLVLWLIFLSSCHTGRPLPPVPIPAPIMRTPMSYSFTCAFPENLRPSVRAGFDYWNDIVPGTFVESLGCDLANGIIVSLSRMSYLRGDGTLDPNTWADTLNMQAHGQIVGSLITFYADWATGDRRVQGSVVRHEIGHVMGFEHSKHGECIMHSSINTTTVKYDDRTKAACPSEIREATSLYGHQGGTNGKRTQDPT